MSDLVRRTITILFTDIVGSTRLWEDLPNEMHTALARHDTLLRTCIEENGGEVVKSTGDGYMAIFGDALSGISAALAAQRALADERWDVSLVTLTGPGGTGKTQLSLQVAESLASNFAAGVTFVDLAPIKDPALAPDAVARELGVIEQPERSLDDSPGHYFAGKEALLILDNFENVMAARTFVAELLARAPQLTIIVTSREVLHLSGEHEYSVPLLNLPDPSLSATDVLLAANEAVALFVEHAQAILPNFTLNEDNARTVQLPIR